MINTITKRSSPKDPHTAYEMIFFVFKDVRPVIEVLRVSSPCIFYELIKYNARTFD